MKVFAVYNPILKCDTLFIFHCKHEEAIDYLNKKYKTAVEFHEGRPVAGQFLTFKDSPYQVVWCADPRNLETLVHELFHLTTRLCMDRNIPIVAHHPNGDNGDETAAYMLEFYVYEVLKKLRRKR